MKNPQQDQILANWLRSPNGQDWLNNSNGARSPFSQPGTAWFQIGDRDPDTGLWEVLSDRGNLGFRGIKTFNQSVPYGTPVRGIPRRDGLITLDEVNLVRSPEVISDKKFLLSTVVIRFTEEFLRIQKYGFWYRGTSPDSEYPLFKPKTIDVFLKQGDRELLHAYSFDLQDASLYPSAIRSNTGINQEQVTFNFANGETIDLLHSKVSGGADSEDEIGLVTFPGSLYNSGYSRFRNTHISRSAFVFHFLVGMNYYTTYTGGWEGLPEAGREGATFLHVLLFVDGVAKTVVIPLTLDSGAVPADIEDADQWNADQVEQFPNQYPADWHPYADWLPIPQWGGRDLRSPVDRFDSSFPLNSEQNKNAPISEAIPHRGIVDTSDPSLFPFLLQELQQGIGCNRFFIRSTLSAEAWRTVTSDRRILWVPSGYSRQEAGQEAGEEYSLDWFLIPNGWELSTKGWKLAGASENRLGFAAQSYDSSYLLCLNNRRFPVFGRSQNAAGRKLGDAIFSWQARDNEILGLLPATDLYFRNIKSFKASQLTRTDAVFLLLAAYDVLMSGFSFFESYRPHSLASVAAPALMVGRPRFMTLEYPSGSTDFPVSATGDTVAISMLDLEIVEA